MPRHRSRYAALCPTLSMVGCCSILHSSFFVILYSFLFILFSYMYTYAHVHVLPSYHLFIDIEKIVGHFLVPHLPISLHLGLYSTADLDISDVSCIAILLIDLIFCSDY